MTILPQLLEGANDAERHKLYDVLTANGPDVDMWGELLHTASD